MAGPRHMLSPYTLGGVLATAGVIAVLVALVGAGRPHAAHAAAGRALSPVRPSQAGPSHAVARASLSPVRPSHANVLRLAPPRVHRVAAAAALRAGAGAGAPGAASANSSSGGIVAELPDPYAAESSPAPASVHHAPAQAPSTAAAAVAAGAPSDAQIRSELAQIQTAEKASASQQAASAAGGSIGGSGRVTPPPGVPLVVAQVIAGANAIATFPYVYGGGHASFVDSAYDCSGSVSYALAAAGLLSAPETSGQLMSWGAPGPGRWITVYANAVHTFMFVDGLRYDTVGRNGLFGSRWQTGPPPENLADFVVRHWPGP
jgi:cell wall-associated NlpC family hydrolase